MYYPTFPQKKMIKMILKNYFYPFSKLLSFFNFIIFVFLMYIFSNLSDLNILKYFISDAEIITSTKLISIALALRYRGPRRMWDNL